MGQDLILEYLYEYKKFDFRLVREGFMYKFLSFKGLFYYK